ncbi:MAG: cold shock domain-containing protein [Bacteroidales bacterium]|nr:cold shock domain-containing protein [Bacteroidales bacterium]MCF8333227.1 cold shock domain-containing protein [Bacteroidales bacterium]
MKGSVKWYNDIKGYGFIKKDDGQDIFVHRSGLEKSFQVLQPGQEVEFEIKQGDKGPVAINVVQLD